MFFFFLNFFMEKGPINHFIVGLIAFSINVMPLCPTGPLPIIFPPLYDLLRIMILFVYIYSTYWIKSIRVMVNSFVV